MYKQSKNRHGNGKGVSDGQRARQPDVARAGADDDAEAAGGYDPVLLARVPVAEILAAEVEGGDAAGAGRELELGEAPQLARWRVGRRGRRQRDVQLRDLGTLDAAGVGDAGRNRRHRLEQVGTAAGHRFARGGAGLRRRRDLEVGIRKVCICYYR